MASPAEIISTTPETLPADFSGWDSEDPLATLPAGPGDFKTFPGPSASPQPPAAQRASARLPVAPVVAMPGNTPSLTPAAAFAEAEDFLNTFRPKYFDPEDLKPKSRHKIVNTKRTMLVAWISVSIVFAAVLISLVYPRLAGRTVTANQSAVRLPAPVAQTSPPSTPLTPKPLASQPLVPAQETSNAQAPESPATVAEDVPPPQVQSETMSRQLTAPTRIPRDVKVAPAKDAPPPVGFGAAGIDSLNGSGSGAMGNVFNGQARPKVKIETPKIVNISAGVAIGMLIQKTPPIYPPIAKTARISGTVVLQAIISKSGTIEDLHVVSGPEMLRQAALDAVRKWRYRPYMLNGQPIAVETTVNLIFSL